jgi:uncharacterized protein (DUF2062 family)
VTRFLERLLHVHDTPQRTAAAYAVGVFFGFSPLLGLHTALGLVAAFALNLNRVAVILGVYSNLPWVIAAYYGFATAAGAALLGVDAPPDFGARIEALLLGSPFARAFWSELAALVRPLLWPFVVGSTIGALLLAALAYRLALAFVRARRAHAAKP